MTTAQVDRDMQACRKTATSRSGVAYSALTGPDLEAFNDCMRKRGYTVGKS